MKNVLSNARFWIFGTVLAASGVIVARVSSAMLTGSSRIATVSLGESLGIAGLFVICLGVSRRLRRAKNDETNL